MVRSDYDQILLHFCRDLNLREAYLQTKQCNIFQARYMNGSLARQRGRQLVKKPSKFYCCQKRDCVNTKKATKQRKTIYESYFYIAILKEKPFKSRFPFSLGILVGFLLILNA